MSWTTIPGLAALSGEEQALALAGAMFDLILLRVTLALGGPLPAATLYAVRGARIRVSPDKNELMIWAPERQAS